MIEESSGSLTCSSLSRSASKVFATRRQPGHPCTCGVSLWIDGTADGRAVEARLTLASERGVCSYEADQRQRQQGPEKHEAAAPGGPGTGNLIYRLYGTTSTLQVPGC